MLGVAFVAAEILLVGRPLLQAARLDMASLAACQASDDIGLLAIFGLMAHLVALEA